MTLLPKLINNKGYINENLIEINNNKLERGRDRVHTEVAEAVAEPRTGCAPRNKRGPCERTSQIRWQMPDGK